MKKILFFLTFTFLVNNVLNSQGYPVVQQLGSNNTLIRLGTTYGGALKGNLIQGVYADTTEANTGYIDLYPGAIIFSTGNATMYVRNAAADGWIALATGLSAINIYTSDGTLTGNRTLAGVGNSLTFSGLSDFLVEDATGEIKLGTSEFNRLRISSGFTAFISLDADSLLMTRLPQSQLLSTDSVLVRTADFKVKTRAVSSIGSTYTAGNGLTLSGSQFKLGGTLTENTTLTGNFRLNLENRRTSILGDTVTIYSNVNNGIDLNNGINNEMLFEANGGPIRFSSVSDFYIPNPIIVGTVPSGASTDSILTLAASTGQVRKRTVSDLVTTPTLQQVLTAGSTLTGNNTVDADGNVLAFTGNYTKFDSLFVSNGTANEDYLIKHRNNLGLGFPVVNITPPGTTARNIAFDIMPVGSPGNYSDNGIAWLDVCDSDISDGSGAVVAARVGVTTSAVQFGSREFGGATAKPIQFVIGSSTKAQIDASTNTGSFNIGKITQSQSVSGDYVGYTLLNTNNSVAESNPIFFIGNDFASLRFGYLRWNNAATSSGLRLPNQLEIASNTAGGVNGGLLLGAWGESGKIRFATGTGAGVSNLAMIIDSTDRIGIGTSSPVSVLHTVGTVRHATLGTASTDTTTYKPLGIDTNGDLIPMSNWPQQKINLVFGAGSGADADTTAFTTSAIYGSFYNDADTIVVTSMRSVLQGTSPDVTYKVWYNDSLNVEAGATALVTAGSQVTNTTTGTNVTSFDVTKIPPGVWVWVKTSTVATKPKYFSLTINGYRK